MMRIGVNGFGRIGRAVLRAGLDRGLDIVAINDLADPESLAHLLKHDSTHGTYDRAVAATPGGLRGRRRADPGDRPPPPLRHRLAGLRRGPGHRGDRPVPLPRRRGDAPEERRQEGAGERARQGHGRDDRARRQRDAAYDPAAHRIISLASCTTNCVAPMVKVLDDTFGLVKGFMTTVHAYTGDQRLLDAPHKDPRRARSAAVNIIPTTTGAARMVGEVLPSLSGRLDGVALRVPVTDGSLTDLSAVVSRRTTVEEVNHAFAQAGGGPLAGVLRYSTAPLVSSDVIGDPASCVFDAPLTQVDGDLVKVLGWYDNEWGYASRLVETAGRIAAE